MLDKSMKPVEPKIDTTIYTIQDELKRKLIERKIREVRYMTENLDPSKIPEINGEKTFEICSFAEEISPFEIVYYPDPDGQSLDVIPFNSTIITIRLPIEGSEANSSYTYILDPENQQVYALERPIYPDPQTSFMYLGDLLARGTPPKPQRRILGFKLVDQILVLDTIQSMLQPAMNSQ